MFKKKKPFQKCVASKCFLVRDQNKTVESTVYIFVRNVDFVQYLCGEAPVIPSSISWQG